MALFDRKCTARPCPNKNWYNPRAWTHSPNATSSLLRSKSCRLPVRLSYKLLGLEKEVEEVAQEDLEQAACHGMPSCPEDCKALFHVCNQTAHIALAKTLGKGQMWRLDIRALEDKQWCHSPRSHISGKKTSGQNPHLCKNRCTSCTWCHPLLGLQEVAAISTSLLHVFSAGGSYLDTQYTDVCKDDAPRAVHIYLSSIMLHRSYHRK